MALLVRAMQGVVFGHLADDRVQIRYTDDALAAMLIKAVDAEVAGRFERLQAFLRKKTGRPGRRAAHRRRRFLVVCAACRRG